MEESYSKLSVLNYFAPFYLCIIPTITCRGDSLFRNIWAPIIHFTIYKWMGCFCKFQNIWATLIHISCMKKLGPSPLEYWDPSNSYYMNKFMGPLCSGIFDHICHLCRVMLFDLLPPVVYVTTFGPDLEVV